MMKDILIITEEDIETIAFNLSSACKDKDSSDAICEALKESLCKIADRPTQINRVLETKVSQVVEVLDVEADNKSCDRNICIQNEYNGVSCDNCIVNGDKR